MLPHRSGAISCALGKHHKIPRVKWVAATTTAICEPLTHPRKRVNTPRGYTPGRIYTRGFPRDTMSTVPATFRRPGCAHAARHLRGTASRRHPHTRPHPPRSRAVTPVRDSASRGETWEARGWGHPAPSSKKRAVRAVDAGRRPRPVSGMELAIIAVLSGFQGRLGGSSGDGFAATRPRGWARLGGERGGCGPPCPRQRRGRAGR